MDGFLKDDDE